MGCIFSKIRKDVSNIDVFDYAPLEYDYLRPRGTIIIDMDVEWNIPVILIDFDGWSQNAVRLWPQNSTQRENFLILERTPLSSPSFLVTQTKMMLASHFDYLSVVELLQNIHDYVHVIKRSYLYCNLTLEIYLK